MVQHFLFQTVVPCCGCCGCCAAVGFRNRKRRAEQSLHNSMAVTTQYQQPQNASYSHAYGAQLLTDADTLQDGWTGYEDRALATCHPTVGLCLWYTTCVSLLGPWLLLKAPTCRLLRDLRCSSQCLFVVLSVFRGTLLPCSTFVR